MVRLGRLATVMVAAAIVSAVPGTALAQAKVRVAVMNFENNSTWTWWGDNLGAAAADELATQLVQTGKYTVIERARSWRRILAEQNLGASGAITAATAAKVGKLLGVQLMLTGSITQFSIQRTSVAMRGIGGTYSNAESKIDARLVNTETGEIMVVAVGQGNKRMGGGYFHGVGAERTFDQGAAQEALRPAVEQVVLKLSQQSTALQSLTPAAPEGQIVSTRSGLVLHQPRTERRRHRRPEVQRPPRRRRDQGRRRAPARQGDRADRRARGDAGAVAIGGLQAGERQGGGERRREVGRLFRAAFRQN